MSEESPTRSMDEVTSRTDTRNEMRTKSQRMFSDVSVYVEGELEVNAYEYELLTKMNEATTNKYKQMSTRCEEISKQTEELNNKYEELEHYFAMIDQLDSSLGQLEHSVSKLDIVTKQLEGKFKALTK